MPIHPAHIDAIARHVSVGYERRARRRQDWTKGMAVAEAVAQAVGDSLNVLSQRMDRDEVLVDLAHVERYTVGLGGVHVTLTLLAASNRRLWHLVHQDGAVVISTPIPMDAVTTQKKTLALSIGVEQSGRGWTVKGARPVVSWVEHIVRTRPQAPVGLVAKVI